MSQHEDLGAFDDEAVHVDIVADPLPLVQLRTRRPSRSRPAGRGHGQRNSRITVQERLELERGRLEYPEDTSSERPRTRAECVEGPRPCPFVSCRYHLYLDVSTRGSLVLNHPGLEVHELGHSCALDVADVQAQTLDEVGFALNLTRERVRQIEQTALRALGSGLADYEGHDGSPEGLELDW